MDEWVSELLVASVSFPGLTNGTYIYVSIVMEDEEVIKCRLKLFKTQKLFLFQVLQHESQFITKSLAYCLVMFFNITHLDYTTEHRTDHMLKHIYLLIQLPHTCYCNILMYEV